MHRVLICLASALTLPYLALPYLAFFLLQHGLPPACSLRPCLCPSGPIFSFSVLYSETDSVFPSTIYSPSHILRSILVFKPTPFHSLPVLYLPLFPVFPAAFSPYFHFVFLLPLSSFFFNSLLHRQLSFLSKYIYPSLHSSPLPLPLLPIHP